MSVHISGDGNRMPLRLVRRFVDATRDYDEDTTIEAGVIGLTGHGLSTGYTTLQGLQTVKPYGDNKCGFGYTADDCPHMNKPGHVRYGHSGTPDGVGI